MLSDHNHKIRLDKYTFALEYDDEFDMSEIEVHQVDEVFALFSGEFSLDGEQMDAPMPGLLVKLTLTRIVSYFIVQVAETFASCLFCFSTPPSYDICFHMQLYIPSALFVLAAYITLFMPPSGLVARSGVPVGFSSLTLILS